MTTPNSFDDALDEILATIGVNGLDDNYVVGRTGAKQALKQLYLTHRNAELEKLLEHSGYVYKHDLGPLGFTQEKSVRVSEIKDLMEEIE